MQFAAASVTGFVADALLLHLLLDPTSTSPLSTRAVTLTAATVIACLVNEAPLPTTTEVESAEDRRRFRPVLIIAALGNYALYVSLISALPGLQPFTSLASASLAAIAFGFFGYARFGSRR